MAALLYALLETAKLVGVDPKRYLRRAATEAISGRTIPLPHQLPELA